MKETKNKNLKFVLRHYQTGKLDTEKALRRVMPAKVVPLWRKWAAAASFAAILIGGAYAAYVSIAPDLKDRTEHQQPVQSPGTLVHHFHFEDTPLPEVLKQLGEHYDVTLTASDTDKRLTADFDSDSLDQTIDMIEQVLDVKIEKNGKK